MSSNAPGNTETAASSKLVPSSNTARISTLADGGWITSWTSQLEEEGDNVVQFQRFDAAGNRVGSQKLVGEESSSYFSPNVVPLADGGWMVVASSNDITMQRFSASGNAIGEETSVNTVGGDLRQSRVTVLTDGGFVVTWNAGAGNEQIKMQRFDSVGKAVGEETLVNTITSGRHFFPVVSALPDGGWVVVWDGADSNGRGSFMQRYDADGEKVGTQTLVNSTTAGDQRFPVITVLEDGGWVVAWQSPDGDQTGIYQQRFDASGNTVGSETLVNTTTERFQDSESVAALADGGWVVVWRSSEDGTTNVKQQRFDKDGNTVGGETLVNVSTGFAADPSVTALDNGAWIVTWVAEDEATSDKAVLQRVFAPDIDGTAGNDSLRGTPFDEMITGLAGNDTLDGKGGDDVLIGGDGNDTYGVDSVRDDVQELAGGGTDTVRASVGYTLGANLENLVLTGSANFRGNGNGLANTITGNSGGNTLRGGGANDVLKGLGGNDTLDGGTGGDRMFGGTGNDTFVVDGRADRVVEVRGQGNDLVKSSISLALATHVEYLLLTGRANLNGTGNGLANTITGNAGNNVLKGGAGNDLLKGGTGRDKLFGEKGADKLLGGGGADQFIFQSPQDSTAKGRGRDFIDDFSRGQGDKINLKAIDADTTHRGNQKFEFIGNDRFDKDAGELRFQKQGGNTLITADRNGDGRADFAILVDGHIAFKGGDFLL